jgi:hypothetical protein
MSTDIDVFILTYCRNPELFYGTSLVFRTLRTGFPTAEISIVDNASLPALRLEVERLAKAAGCQFRTIDEPGVPHHEFIDRTLHEVAARPGPERTVVFVDPDVCLWRDCESLAFDGLAAGMLLEAHHDTVMQCLTMPRLHTSFLWFPEPRRLLAEIERVRRAHFDFHPFLSSSVKLGDVWLRYDTGAGLYAALPTHCQAFGEPHMDYYDHLYAGSHFDLWRGKHPGELRELMEWSHRAAAAGDLAALRGLWRRQKEAWYRSVEVVRMPHDGTGAGGRGAA